jgi:hypothetical protein
MIGQGIVPKKHTTEGNEATNKDCWGCRADSIVGLLQLQTHEKKDSNR